MIVGIEATHALKDRRTGVEEVCWQIIKNLKSVIPSAVRVILYVNSRARAVHSDMLENLPANWSVKELRWPFGKGWSQIRLAVELWRRPPDVFFAPGQLIPFHCPRNTIVYLHDNAFLAQPKVYGFLSRWYLRLMNRLIVHKAHRIVTSTEFNRTELGKYYGADILKRVVVAPLAYNEAYNIPVAGIAWSSELLLQKYNLRQPYLMYVGRLEEKKNTRRLIEAFNLLRRGYQSLASGLQLLLVGPPGVGYPSIKLALEASAAKPDIITPGWVDPADLPGLLHSAEFFVFPSLYEGFGIPILEAMASGKPVVVSDIPALREVGGDAPEYVDPLSSEDIARGIGLVLSNRSLRESRVAIGLARCHQFSWQRTAAYVWKVIQDCQAEASLI